MVTKGLLLHNEVEKSAAVPGRRNTQRWIRRLIEGFPSILSFASFLQVPWLAKATGPHLRGRQLPILMTRCCERAVNQRITSVLTVSDYICGPDQSLNPSAFVAWSWHAEELPVRSRAKIRDVLQSGKHAVKVGTCSDRFGS